ncbi:hypothetical protein AB0M94_37315 [Streptomyces xanthochromogenes]|uniref:hypothetical protein n=1 Tax=Streptomyces xanthochromogenes TaxID=67384 RepID=UPI00341B72E4
MKLDIQNLRGCYTLSADPVGDGRIELTLMICETTGEIRGELTGEMDAADLNHVSQLLEAAARACAPVAPSPHDPPRRGRNPPAPRRGEAWTAEETRLLLQRFRDGGEPSHLAAEFERSEKSIRWKLFGLQVAPFPADLAPERHVSPPCPAPPKAYSVEEERQIHPNAYRAWEENDKKRLAERCAQGASSAELSREFGRKVTAIWSQLNKISAVGPAADEARERGA